MVRRAAINELTQTPTTSHNDGPCPRRVRMFAQRITENNIADILNIGHYTSYMRGHAPGAHCCSDSQNAPACAASKAPSVSMGVGALP